MSSINEHFTFHYSQPDEYHFSHDSVFFARAVYELTKAESLAGKNLLDLCCGCGIIGLDYLYHRFKDNRDLPGSVNFFDVQTEFEKHILNNIERSGLPLPKTAVTLRNYASDASASLVNCYDLILCNPPYFHLRNGKLGSSPMRNRCHFYLDSSFAELIEFMISSLTKNGRSYFLSRDFRDHGEDIRKLLTQLCDTTATWNELPQIRGTLMFQITKL